MSKLDQLAAKAKKDRAERDRVERICAELKPDAFRLLEPIFKVSGYGMFDNRGWGPQDITKKELFEVIQERLATEKFFVGKKVTLQMSSLMSRFKRPRKEYNYFYSETFRDKGNYQPVASFYFSDDNEILIEIDSRWPDYG